MHQMSILLSSIFLESFLITPFALTLPPLRALTQTNHTASPLLFIDDYNFHLNLTTPPLAECHYIDDPPMSALSSAKCAFLTGDTCSDLAQFGPEARDQWIWHEISGCALGYYIPGGAAVPSLYQCDNLIFDKIRRECAGDLRYNAGSINVLQLPHWGDDGTDFFGGIGRFLMAPERLTL